MHSFQAQYRYMMPAAAAESRWMGMLLAGICLVAAAVIPYLPFLHLPLISDGYIQVILGRQYGKPEQWTELASDVLYRSRATSIWLTSMVDHFWGAEPLAHRLLNLLIHAGNVLLVASLGRWRQIGWQVSLPAAVVFALIQNHQEAIVWCAALPELLVFAFSIMALVGWVRWLEAGRWLWVAVFGVGFVLALLSKESGVVVVPLAALTWWRQGKRNRVGLAVLGLSGIGAAVYTWLILNAGASHLHLTDGTFSLRAPFYETLAVSVWRLMMPWGLLSLAILWFLGRQWEWSRLKAAMVWMALTLLPYSFVEYMNRVPSRHTYLATLGLAAVIALGWSALARQRNGRALAWTLATAFLAFNVTYLWTKKLDQYKRRVEPTERFLRFASEQHAPVRIACGPYGEEVYRAAARVRLGAGPDFVAGPEGRQGESWREYCDTAKP